MYLLPKHESWWCAGVEGHPCRTKAGELSLDCSKVSLHFGIFGLLQGQFTFWYFCIAPRSVYILVFLYCSKVSLHFGIFYCSKVSLHFGIFYCSKVSLFFGNFKLPQFSFTFEQIALKGTFTFASLIRMRGTKVV